MAAKQKIVAADGVFRIIQTNSKGDEEIKDSIKEVEGMDIAQAVRAYLGFVGDAPNKRRAAVSLLCHIIVGAQDAGKKLEKHKGTGDPTVGQLKQSFKDDFTKAEDAFFDAMRDKDHPQHKAFMGALPKLTERGEPIEKDGKADPDEKYAYFMRSLRKEPTYATNKNLVLNFWHFVGKDPYTVDKNGMLHIIPPEAMRVMVNNAKNVKPADNSWEAKMIGLCRELYMPDDPKNPVLLLDEVKRGEVIKSLQLALDEAQRQDKIAKARPSMSEKLDAASATREAMQAAAKPHAPESTGEAKRVKGGEHAPID